jgi:hypothetical protein
MTFVEDSTESAALTAQDVHLVRRGESSIADVEAAEALADAVSRFMVSVATGGPAIKTVDAEYKRQHRALGAVLRRLGIKYPNQFDDLWGWYGRWSNGSLPSYRDRRLFVSELFAPVRQALVARADAAGELVEGVSEWPTGWPRLDQQIARLRRLWREADDPDAYNGVGLQCLKILTTLGHVVFDSARHLLPGEKEPGPDDAKKRVGYFLRRVASGEKGDDIRKIVNGAYGQANTAKHRHLATRTDAGIAANATLLIVSTLRLLVDEEEDLASPPRDDGLAF